MMLPRRCRRPCRASRPDGSRPAPSATEPAAAAGHYAADRSNFRRHTRCVQPAPLLTYPWRFRCPFQRRTVERYKQCHPCFDTALSDGTESSNPLSSSAESVFNVRGGQKFIRPFRRSARGSRLLRSARSASSAKSTAQTCICSTTSGSTTVLDNLRHRRASLWKYSASPGSMKRKIVQKPYNSIACGLGSRPFHPILNYKSTRAFSGSVPSGVWLELRMA
jgi:hypothetical protein